MEHSFIAAIDNNTFNKLKKKYLALDKDDEKSYNKKVKKLLPKLLWGADQGKVLSPQDIGIAKVVSDPKYPLALLTGDDVNLVKSESKTESINGSINAKIGKKRFFWARTRATGFYAAPGEIVTVTIPEDLLYKISVVIGHFRYAIKYKPFVRTTHKFASPFGGFLRVRLHNRWFTTKKGMFNITVDNAVEAPHFVLGQSTNEGWETIKLIKKSWAK